LQDEQQPNFSLILISLLAFAVAGIVFLIAAGIFGAKKRPRKADSFLLTLDKADRIALPTAQHTAIRI